MPLRNKIDPTGTQKIVKAFQRDISKRLRFIAQQCRKLIVGEDAFGLKVQEIQGPAALFNTRFKFNTNPEKVAEFQEWLDKQIAAGFYSKSPSGEGMEWAGEYITDAYRKAQVRAYVDAKASGVSSVKGMTQREFLLASMAGDHSTQQIKTLYTRAFTELKGMTQEMDTQLSRVLADGLVKGLGAEELARAIELSVGNIDRTRARRIARTEIIRSYAESQLDALEAMGVESVGVMVEWATAEDPCELCAELKGVLFTIQEARGLIPRHPNCRCAFIPANLPFQETKGQKKSKSRVEAALEASLQAENPKRTAAENRERSRWAGADTEVAKTRPQKLEIVEEGILESEIEDRSESKATLVVPAVSTKSPNDPIEEIIERKVKGEPKPKDQPKLGKETNRREIKLAVKIGAAALASVLIDKKPKDRPKTPDPFAEEFDETLDVEIKPISQKVITTTPDGRKKINGKTIRRRKIRVR